MQTGTLAKESGFAIGYTPKLGAYEGFMIDSIQRDKKKDRTVFDICSEN